MSFYYSCPPQNSLEVFCMKYSINEQYMWKFMLSTVIRPSTFHISATICNNWRYCQILAVLTVIVECFLYQVQKEKKYSQYYFPKIITSRTYSTWFCAIIIPVSSPCWRLVQTSNERVVGTVGLKTSWISVNKKSVPEPKSTLEPGSVSGMDWGFTMHRL